MTYKLKTTGLATHLKMCIAVDPDTDTIKDFASATVTADMSVGAGITIGSQAWDGNTRKYFQLTSGNHVAFGTNKPGFECQASHQFQSVVWIGEAAGAMPIVFGYNSASYFDGNDPASGGSRHPSAALASNYLTGNQAQLAAGSKRIFGWSLSRNGVTDATFNYTAADTATSGAVKTFTLSSGTVYSLSYVGRRNDYNDQQNGDKIHAILIFDNAITQSDFDSLRDDWFSVLLEQEVTGASGGYSITTEDAVFSGGASSQGLGSFAITTADATFSGGATMEGLSGLFNITTADAAFSGGATGYQVQGTITVPQLRNLTIDGSPGTLRTGETGIIAVVNQLTGELVVRKTGLTSDGTTANCVFTDPLIVTGNTYRVTTILSDGSEGTWKYQAT